MAAYWPLFHFGGPNWMLIMAEELGIKNGKRLEREKMLVAAVVVVMGWGGVEDDDRDFCIFVTDR